MRAELGAQPNQSLIDGISILQALSCSPDPIGGRELARQLNLDPTKVNRLLKTLTFFGIARQTANRKYTTGPGMHVLAAQSLFASGFVNKVTPTLEGMRKFGHTVALGVLWNENVSFLFHAPPGLELSRGLGRIGLMPATKSSIGTALLAQFDEEHIINLYDGKDIPLYPQGIEQLLDKLREVKQLGYARIPVQDDRNHHSVAVTCGNPAHAGIGMSGWIPEGATQEVVESLWAAADLIN